MALRVRGPDRPLLGADRPAFVVSGSALGTGAISGPIVQSRVPLSESRVAASDGQW